MVEPVVEAVPGEHRDHARDADRRDHGGGVRELARRLFPALHAGARYRIVHPVERAQKG